MRKRTIGIIAAILAALFFGISGFFLAFAGGIPALVSYLPAMQGAALNVPGSSTASPFAMLSGLGACCICIPIPLTFGFFALYQQAKASLVKEPPSQASDI